MSLHVKLVLDCPLASSCADAFVGPLLSQSTLKPYETLFTPIFFYVCSVTNAQLAAAADSMLEACQRSDGDGNDGKEQTSYNVLLTRNFLQMIPRSTEFSGPVAVNSLGPAGTFFVRSADHLSYVEERTPMGVLCDVGFKW